MAEMMIDNQDIKIFGARLLSFSVGGSSITRNMSATNNCNIPFVFSSDIGTRQLTVTIVFQPSRLGDDSKNTTIPYRLSNSTENVARFEGYVLSHETVELLLPDGFYYSSVCTAIGAAAEMDATGEQEIVYTFTAVRHKELTTKKLTGASTKLDCQATTPVKCKITLTASQSYNSLTIMGITVYKLSAGDVLVIDGIKGKITVNNENKFTDSNLVEFPTLQPGENIIKNTAISSQCSISYYPVYC